MKRFVFAPPADDVRSMIGAAIEEIARKGVLPPRGKEMRLLVGEDHLRRFSHLACRCGSCAKSNGHRKEQQLCHCSEFQVQISSTMLRLCMRFEPAAS